MKYKKKRILVFSSIFAVILATFASAFHFNIIANASTDGIAYYGEQLSTETPSALGGSEYTGYSWTDDETDYFGEIGEQVFVVSNGSDYKNLTITVQPRELNPVLKYGNLSSTVPTEWAGNPNKHVLSDFMGTTTFNANGGIFDPNIMEVTDSLPTKVGDVSIMTLGQAFTALGGSSNVAYDPSYGYDTSTYYMYGITGSNGADSTAENLQAVGLNWYKQLNKPTSLSQTFTSNGKTIFGGPLYFVFALYSDYNYRWYFNTNSSAITDPGASSYWDSPYVAPSVHVAIVRAVGDTVVASTTHTETTVVGTAVTLPPEPTREGYSFTGWWTTADDSGEEVTDTTQGEGDTTLYAHWTRALATTTFDANGGAFNPNMKITDALPTRLGNVSIMTLEQAYVALGGSTSETDFIRDPSYGYDTSTYYMYAINDTQGTNDAASVSTSANLQAVGLSWYQELNKPTTKYNHWTVGNHKLFGGPLGSVLRNAVDDSYYFDWFYSTGQQDSSPKNVYWCERVSGSVYVAVVCAVGDATTSTTHTETIAIGSCVTFPAEPIREGYDFDGWYTQDEGGEKVTSIIQGVTPNTYYAHWSVPSTIAVTSSLPTKVGDVSIMTIGQVFTALENSNSENSSNNHYDPTSGYNTSTYYVYGICDSTGFTGSTTGSTATNLQAIGLQWYKQLNKPTTDPQTWTQANHKVFGGPFYGVRNSGSYYYFHWWYGTGIGDNSFSRSGDYWNNIVDTGAYLAVVCAHE